MRRLPWAALPALLFLPVLFLPPANHDAAAILSFSQRWLAGERLYVDLIDVNPPLIFVLNLVPAALSGGSGPGGLLALRLCLVAVAILVAFVARPPKEDALLAAVPALLLVGPGYDLGQREPLMALLAWPYLLDAAARIGGAPARVTPTLLGAVGFALKPHFVLIPLLVEARVLMEQRRIDRAPVILSGAALAYLGATLLLFPDYLGHILPMARAAYIPSGWSYADILAQPRWAATLLLLALVTPFAWRRPLPRILALAALGAAAAALIQGKGWSYHLAPVELLTLIVAGLLAAPALPALPRMAAIMVWLLASGDMPWNQLKYADVIDPKLVAALEGVGGERRVLVLAHGVAPVYPALPQANATATQPVTDLWPLGCPGEAATAPVLRRQIAEGIAARSPDAILLDRAPPCAEAVESLVPADARAAYRRARDIGPFRLLER